MSENAQQYRMIMPFKASCLNLWETSGQRKVPILSPVFSMRCKKMTNDEFIFRVLVNNLLSRPLYMLSKNRLYRLYTFLVWLKV